MDAKIYLCKTDNSILGSLTGIQIDTCNLTKNATDLWEITFDVDRFIDENGELKQSDFYDSIDEMMRLYIDGENLQAFFVIDSEPTIKGENNQEVKSVTAHSIECELGDVYLKNFKVNCGTFDSQEYLATDADGNSINIDPYTNLPIEYISLINYDNPQLSLLHLVLQGTDWTVEDNIDPEVCSIKKSFESSESVYAFLMKQVSPTASVIFEFDRKHQKVGVVKAENYGKDTSIFITMRNLMNSFEVTSSSDDNIITKLVPTGANDLGIEYVNFGESSIINLDYFMNTLNEYGDYKYVSKDLHDKYVAWKYYRDEEKILVNEQLMTRRDEYIYYTKYYNESIMQISELKNRVLNDGCCIDYKTFSLEELKTSLTAYNNALLALITIYKNEYNKSEVDDFIKETPYWYDYYAYNDVIIPQVTEALKMYCQTDNNGDLVYDENGELIELEFGNSAYYEDETIVKEVDAYKYEWSLYGLDELKAKRKAWLECTNVLYDECFIGGGVADDPIYRRPTDSGWNSLSKEQQSRFTSKEAFFNKLNQYLDYMDTSERDNSLTKTNGKGIIRQCEDAIEQITHKILVLEESQQKYNEIRKQISKDVAMDNFFNEDDMDVINSMLITQDYNNANILTTNLDDIVSTIEVQKKMYQDAMVKLYEISQPQYDFKTELDNLYSLEEFKAYREPFEVGNFIRVGLETHEELCENNYVKLRLMSISYNPLETSEDLTVEFSTMTKSLNTISDLAFLLDSQNSSTSSGGSSSTSSGGTYGNNDANIQISNNMLNALLKNESFGTTVSDVVLQTIKANKGNFNNLFANSGAFDSLEAGQIKISGDCLFNKIQSSNFSEINEEGSMLNLADGAFNFSGGTFTYDVENGLQLKMSCKVNHSIMSYDSVNDEYYYIHEDVVKVVSGSMSNTYEDQILYEFYVVYDNNFDMCYIKQNRKIGEETWNLDYNDFGNLCIATEYNDDEYSHSVATFNYDNLFYTIMIDSSSQPSTSESYSFHTYFDDKNNKAICYNEKLYYYQSYEYYSAFYGNTDKKRNGGFYVYKFTEKKDGAGELLLLARYEQVVNTGGFTNIYPDISQFVYNKVYDSQNGSFLFNKNEMSLGNFLSYNTKNDELVIDSGGFKLDKDGIQINNSHSFNLNIMEYDEENNEYYYIYKSEIYDNESLSTVLAEFYIVYDKRYNMCFIKKVRLFKNEIWEDWKYKYEYAGTNDIELLGYRTIDENGNIFSSFINNGCLSDISFIYDDKMYSINNKYNMFKYFAYFDSEGNKLIYHRGKPYYLLDEKTLTYSGITYDLYVFNTKLDNTGELFMLVNDVTDSKTSDNITYPENIYKIFYNIEQGKNTYKFNMDGVFLGDALSYNVIDDTFEINTNNFKLNSNGDVELGGIKNNIYLNGDGYSYIDKQTNNIVSLGYKHDTIDTVAVSNFSHNEQIGLLISCETPLTEENNGIKYEGDNKLELDYDRIRIYNNSKTYYSEDEIYTEERMTTVANGEILIQEYGENTIEDGDIPVPGLHTIFRIDRDNLICPVVCENTTSSGSQVRIDESGYFYIYSSSSERYKDNITTNISEGLNPHKLYDIDVVQFNYKDGYLSKDDQRYNKDIIGFIAEDIYEKYPIACNLDKEGFPEVPEYNLLIAPMLKLIQEQHEEIEKLKEEVEKLKSK